MPKKPFWGVKNFDLFFTRNVPQWTAFAILAMFSLALCLSRACFERSLDRYTTIFIFDPKWVVSNFGGLA